MPALLNGKRSEKAKSTKMVTEEKATKPVEVQIETEEEQEEQEEPKKSKLTLLKKLEPEMLSNPYPVDLPGISQSDEFCLEKCNQFILEPLADAIANEKDWLDFARAVWQWRNQAEERRIEAMADDLIARAEEDPRILGILREKLAA